MNFNSILLGGRLKKHCYHKLDHCKGEVINLHSYSNYSIISTVLTTVSHEFGILAVTILAFWRQKCRILDNRVALPLA